MHGASQEFCCSTNQRLFKLLLLIPVLLMTDITFLLLLGNGRGLVCGKTQKMMYHMLDCCINAICFYSWFAFTSVDHLFKLFWSRSKYFITLH